jgi:hypothetical protein
MDRTRIILLSFLLIATPSLAQEQYVPPDKDLWTQMERAFEGVSMPLAAHQQIKQIMQTVEQEAIRRSKEMQSNQTQQGKPK